MLPAANYIPGVSFRRAQARGWDTGAQGEQGLDLRGDICVAILHLGFVEREGGLPIIFFARQCYASHPNGKLVEVSSCTWGFVEREGREEGGEGGGRAARVLRSAVFTLSPNGWGIPGARQTTSKKEPHKKPSLRLLGK